MMNMAGQILQREASTYQSWVRLLLSFAMGGICFILFFDYCTLTDSGRALVQKAKQEIKACLSEIDFRSLVKPVVWMFVVYLLGILTIIRANFLYRDDLARAIRGFRGWHDWSRYVSEFSSIFVHGDTHLTDISPLPQLLAILILSVSSVLLVYVTGNKKITTVRLLASIPLGLSPFFLECLIFKFDAPYMALSILVSIVPFLFISRKKAFLFCSIACLLMMWTTYQAASGVYLMIVLILCFQDWNSRKKSSKEILVFLGQVALAFGLALLLFKFFLMKTFNEQESAYVSNAMYPVSTILSGAVHNLKNYAMTINGDLGIVWKIGILLVLFFFVVKSIRRAAQRIVLSFLASITVLALSFILSFGAYSFLITPLYAPRAFLGLGVFLSIVCVYVVSDYTKWAKVIVLALNWCFFIFAFSYGNALADQTRYAEFRIEILLHDLSTLYPNRNREELSFNFKNVIDYAPSIQNIAKNYPLIEKLVPRRLGDYPWDDYYCLEYFNFTSYSNTRSHFNDDFDDLPVVLDSYYHTIKSDGSRVLILLKH